MKKGVLWSKRVVAVSAGMAAVLVSAGLVSGGIYHLKEKYKEHVSGAADPTIIYLDSQSEGTTTSSEAEETTSDLLELNENDKRLESKKAYAKNIDFYLDARGVKLDDPNKLVGNNYSIVNFGGATTSMLFNEDGTYSYTYEARGKKETVNGIYKISNQTIVCEGGFILVDGIKYKLIENTEIYANALTNNTCVFGSSEKNGTLEPVLKYQELIEEK